MKNDLTNTLALYACEQLVRAYKNGKANGGSIEWNDLDHAHLLAQRALKAETKKLKKGKK
jgi:hypothetical protein